MTEQFPIHWPTALLPPQSIEFTRRYMSRSGGMSVAGNEQVVASATDYWTASLRAKIVRYEQELALRGMLAEADGRVGTWLVPTCSGFQRLASGRAVGVPTLADVPFSDQSTFADSALFETRMILGNASGASALRARALTVRMQAGNSAPLAGHYFSIGENLYAIATSAPATDGVVDGFYALTFRPGLRLAVPDGAVLDFTRPVCRMRLASDESGRRALDLLRFADVSLDFVEDPTPAT